MIVERSTADTKKKKSSPVILFKKKEVPVTSVTHDSQSRSPIPS